MRVRNGRKGPGLCVPVSWSKLVDETHPITRHDYETTALRCAAHNVSSWTHGPWQRRFPHTVAAVPRS
jgi:hypothetical protein